MALRVQPVSIILGGVLRLKIISSPHPEALVLATELRQSETGLWILSLLASGLKEVLLRAIGNRQI
jgi:hypothetical protein